MHTAARHEAQRAPGTGVICLADGREAARGLDVQLVNISSSGLLVESGARFMPGSSTVFRLSGPNKNVVVAGRVVRSQVATVNSLGVKYRAAAAFDEKLEGLAPQPAAVTGSDGPSALADVLGLCGTGLSEGVIVRAPIVFEQASNTCQAVRFEFATSVVQTTVPICLLAVPSDGGSQASPGHVRADYRPRREGSRRLGSGHHGGRSAADRRRRQPLTPTRTLGLDQPGPL